MSGYTRRDGTTVRAYTQHRAGGNGSGGSAPLLIGVLVVVVLVGACVGVTSMARSVFGTSSLVSRGLRPAHKAVPIGKVTFRFADPSAHIVVQKDDDKARVTFSWVVENQEAVAVTISDRTQELRMAEGGPAVPERFEVVIPSRKSAEVTMVFVVADDQEPVSLVLGGGRGKAELRLGSA